MFFSGLEINPELTQDFFGIGRVFVKDSCVVKVARSFWFYRVCCGKECVGLCFQFGSAEGSCFGLSFGFVIFSIKASKVCRILFQSCLIARASGFAATTGGALANR